jgi:hypothetical protein
VAAYERFLLHYIDTKISVDNLACDPSKFPASKPVADIVAKEFPVAEPGLPKLVFSFAPHKKPTFSLNTLVQALKDADSSVIFDERYRARRVLRPGAAPRGLQALLSPQLPDHPAKETRPSRGVQ